MNMKKGSASAGKPANSDSTSSLRPTGKKEFWLVVIMLATLFILILAALSVAAWRSDDSNMVEYSKWALTTLLGTFGAWIGAGAAYFFGIKNLAESSRSTEKALEIQRVTLRGASKPERISDLELTAMNKEFMFNPSIEKKDVIIKVNDYPAYWWVPVLDAGGNGILEDIIHARVFCEGAFKDNDPISKIVSDIDTTPALKKKYGALHGASFFVKAALDDKIDDVLDNMNKSGAAVGVVVDEKGKPTYCFTKQDLLNVQK